MIRPAAASRRTRAAPSLRRVAIAAAATAAVLLCSPPRSVVVVVEAGPLQALSRASAPLQQQQNQEQDGAAAVAATEQQRPSRASGEGRDAVVVVNNTSGGATTAADTAAVLLSKLTRLFRSSGGGSAVVTAIDTRHAVILGLLLALNSGYMNGLTLAGMFGNRNQAVAAMTGSYTNSAIALASSKLDAFWFNVRLLFFYVGGAAIAGALNPNPVPFRIQSGAGPALLLAGSFVGWASRISSDSSAPDWAVFCLAACANGIQNSLTSAYSGNLLRTTHYTGISSDIGTILGQIARGNTANLPKLKVFAGLAACFWLGGYASYMLVDAESPARALAVSSRLYLALGAVLVYKQWKQLDIQSSVS